MPRTDFEAVYPNDDDIPSQMDVFNEDNEYHAKMEREKQLQKEIDAAQKKLLRQMRGEEDDEAGAARQKDVWS